MRQKNYLIVGATSVAGQSAITEIRTIDSNAKIIGTTSKEEPLSFVDSSICGVDLANENALSIIEQNLNVPIDTMIFCPAYGMVGYPSEYAPMSDIETCFQFSVRPILSLMQSLSPKITVGFSAFYWLKSLRVSYGSMAYAKYAIERLAVQNPDRLRIVRSGLFPSKSLRAIALLVQRTVQKASFPESIDMKSDWKNSGLSFADFFTVFAQNYEREMLSEYLTTEYRCTTEKDLAKGIGLAVQEDSKAIINIVGDSTWFEDQLTAGLEFLERNKPAFELANSFSLSKSKVEHK